MMRHWIENGEIVQLTHWEKVEGGLGRERPLELLRSICKYHCTLHTNNEQHKSGIQNPISLKTMSKWIKSWGENWTKYMQDRYWKPQNTTEGNQRLYEYMGKHLMFLNEDNNSEMANLGLQIQNTTHQNSSWLFLSYFCFLAEIDKLIPKFICMGMQGNHSSPNNLSNKEQS